MVVFVWTCVTEVSQKLNCSADFDTAIIRTDHYRCYSAFVILVRGKSNNLALQRATEIGFTSKPGVFYILIFGLEAMRIAGARPR